MAGKKDGLFDEVPDAPPGEGAALGGTHAAPAEQVSETSAEPTDGKDATQGRPPVPPEGFVSEQALRDTRDELKAIKRQLRDRDRAYGTLEERTNIILKRLAEEDGQPQHTNGQPAKGKGAPGTGAPDPELDIFGAVKHDRREIEQLKAGYSQFEQHRQQAQVAETITSAYRQDAERLAREKPDFSARYAYLINIRDQELQLSGVTDMRQRQAIIESEELGLSAQQFQQEGSPAEYIYKLAELRGYRPDPNQQPSQGNDALRPDLNRIARGQEQNRSLSGAAGAPQAGGLDAKALARMSEDDIHALMRTRNGYKAVNKAMGIG